MRLMIVTLVGLACAATAWAKQPQVPPVPPVQCEAKSAMLERLRARYDETPAIMARNSRGLDVIMTANPSSGTCTLLVAGPDGRACLLDSGQGFAAPRVAEPGTAT